MPGAAGADVRARRGGQRGSGAGKWDGRPQVRWYGRRVPQPEVLAAINADVWTPFADGYATGDAERYLAVHAGDFVRVDADADWVGGLEAYAADVRRFFGRLAERGDQARIAFRFVERLADAGIASERGVYRLVFSVSDGTERIFHGAFHTLARRTDAGWRLFVDYNTSAGGTAEAFDAARAVDDLAAFGPAPATG